MGNTYFWAIYLHIGAGGGCGGKVFGQFEIRKQCLLHNSSEAFWDSTGPIVTALFFFTVNHGVVSWRFPQDAAFVKFLEVSVVSLLFNRDCFSLIVMLVT